MGEGLAQLLFESNVLTGEFEDHGGRAVAFGGGFAGEGELAAVGVGGVEVAELPAIGVDIDETGEVVDGIRAVLPAHGRVVDMEVVLAVENRLAGFATDVGFDVDLAGGPEGTDALLEYG